MTLPPHPPWTPSPPNSIPNGRDQQRLARIIRLAWLSVGVRVEVEAVGDYPYEIRSSLLNGLPR